MFFLRKDSFAQEKELKETVLKTNLVPTNLLKNRKLDDSLYDF